MERRISTNLAKGRERGEVLLVLEAVSSWGEAFVQQLPLSLTSHLFLCAALYEIVMTVVKQMQINNGWMNTSWDE